MRRRGPGCHQLQAPRRRFLRVPGLGCCMAPSRFADRASGARSRSMLSRRSPKV